MVSWLGVISSTPPVDHDHDESPLCQSKENWVPPTPESLYTNHYLKLVRTAALLTDDRGVAEEVVQEAFSQIIARWQSIDPDKALAYLYRAVSNGSKSTLRRRRTARAYIPDAQDLPVGLMNLHCAQRVSKFCWARCHGYRHGNARCWCCATTANLPLPKQQKHCPSRLPQSQWQLITR